MKKITSDFLTAIRPSSISSEWVISDSNGDDIGKYNWQEEMFAMTQDTYLSLEEVMDLAKIINRIDKRQY